MESTDTTPQNHGSGEQSDDAAQPTYLSVRPACPVCQNSKFESTEEGVPNNFDTHYVHVRCARCKTQLTIEYRAIDVFWHGGFDGQHSAVSQDFLTPNQNEYADEVSYGVLPDSDLLSALDWPLTCDCGENLTGNELVSDPTVLPDHDVDYDDPNCEIVLFQCVNCDNTVTKTPAHA